MPSSQICRQCRLRLAPSSSSIALQVRPFSSTTARRKNGILILSSTHLIFHPAANKPGALPALSTPPGASTSLRIHLDTIRMQIFLPSHLRQTQKRLIYRRKHWDVLKNEPITVDIDDEDFTLQPIDRTKDVPDSWTALSKALEMLGNDVDNWRGAFVGLLEGFRDAGRRWKQWQMESLIRKAGEAGMVRFVVDAAVVGERTGVRFSDVRVVREVLWGCRTLMVRCDGDATVALKLAEQIAALCDEKMHRADVSHGEIDPRTQPDSIGVLLELATSTEKQDEDKIQKYAGRLLASLERSPINGDELEAVEQELQNNGKMAAVADYQLMRWLPIMQGLSRAIDTLGTDMPRVQFAKEQRDMLQQRVQDLKDTLENSQDPGLDRRRGLKWLQKVEA